MTVRQDEWFCRSFVPWFTHAARSRPLERQPRELEHETEHSWRTHMVMAHWYSPTMAPRTLLGAVSD